MTVDTFNYRVGIGTTNPTHTLQVHGALLVSSSSQIIPLQNGNVQWYAQAYTAGVKRVRIGAYDGIAASHIPFILNEDGGGGLGIGTSTVNGTIQFANTNTRRRIVFWENANNDHQVTAIGKGSGTMNFQNGNSGDDFVFNVGASASASTELMRIKGTGFVGIGNTNPIYKLDVTGSMRLSNAATDTQLFLEPNLGSYASIAATTGASAARSIVLNKDGGNVGIGTASPQCKLDVNAYTAGVDGFVAVRSIANDTNSKTCLANLGATYASLAPCANTNANLYVYWRGGASGTTDYRALIVGSTPYFTGQHGNVCVTSTITKATLKDYVGLIVSSADEGYISLDASGNPITGSNAIWTTEALPKIKLTEKDKDKAVWGVLTNHKNESRNTDGTWDIDDTTEWGDSLGERFRVNGLGEGAIWVTDINGPLENGDYICSSVIPGYGRRQDDDLLHNYTVAKITMSCDFTLDQSNYRCEEMEWNGSTFRKAYVGCTYHCS
jgi:hypothetical protein